MRQKTTSRTLEAYLSAMWSLGRTASGEDALSADQFFRLLSSAFDVPIPEFDEAWRSRYDPDNHVLCGFPGWEAMILRQIVDLREMDEVGTLANELRYFGVNSPRGGYWYNFDPWGFLECATAGSFGGCRPGHDEGRHFAPGTIEVKDESSDTELRDRQNVEDTVFTMPLIPWDAFRDYLWYGQHYE